MKKIIALVFICMIMLSKTSIASHSFGAEMTYTCLGNDQYAITYIFYRNCFGIVPPNVMTIQIDNICSFPITSFDLNLTPSSPTLITHECAGQPTTCNGGNAIGIEKYVYTGIITLPNHCDQWIISENYGQRDAALEPLLTPDAENLYVSAIINNSNSLCNNSPVFNNPPTVVACLNQTSCIDPGIYESDGDSIVCVMSPPLTDGNTPVGYKSNYTFDQPVFSNQPVTIDQTTGEICFTASQQEFTLFKILVSEYRNGILIGQVVRDLDLFVVNCTGNPPTLSGIDNSVYFSISTCANTPTCFKIYSNDFDPNDSTNIVWSHSISNATLTTYGAMHDSAYFCWTPTLADVSSTPFNFTATVSDNGCPNIRSQTYHYSITVHDSATNCFYLSAENNLKKLIDLKIYPQPATDHLIIDFGSEFKSTDNYQLQINNIIGQKIYQSKINERIMKVDLNNFNQGGVFSIFITDEKSTILQREKIIIIQ